MADGGRPVGVSHPRAAGDHLRGEPDRPIGGRIRRRIIAPALRRTLAGRQPREAVGRLSAGAHDVDGVRGAVGGVEMDVAGAGIWRICARAVRSHDAHHHLSLAGVVHAHGRIRKVFPRERHRSLLDHRGAEDAGSALGRHDVVIGGNQLRRAVRGPGGIGRPELPGGIGHLEQPRIAAIRRRGALCLLVRRGAGPLLHLWRRAEWLAGDVLFSKRWSRGRSRAQSVGLSGCKHP